MDEKSNNSGASWRIERQQNQCISQQTTRVLQSQIRLTSKNIQNSTSSFPLIMEMDTKDKESDLMELMRKKMEMNSLNFMNSGSELNNSFFSNSSSGAAMKFMNNSQESKIFSGSRTASVQQQSSISSDELPDWMREKLGNEKLINGSHKLSGIHKQFSLSSNSAALGVSRSFSTNSDFPLSSTSSSLKSGFDQIEGNENGEKQGSNSNFGLQLSPRRFQFRNFEGPVWNDFPDFEEKLSLSPNRKTWDLSSDLIKTRKVHFSASQSQQILESTSSNGSFRAAAYQDNFFVRQSFGPSESEESEDDEDDFFSPRQKKYLMSNAKPAIGYKKKLALMDKPSAPSEDDTTSSICPSEQDNLDIESTNDSNFVEHQSPSSPENNTKAFKVAQELVETERKYVKILNLIDQIFHFRVAQENRVQQMFPPETLNQIFCNIKSIYTLHHDHLLPRLEERLERWNDDPRIGDIMVEFSPFLKMYSEYVQNFDNSLNLINFYKDKNPRFAAVINEIQAMEECQNLPIQHHLIAPIQRIPRYRLLLEAYLKRLSKDSNDLKETIQALEIVSKAAEHANEAMKRIVSFKKLLEAQEQIRGVVDLVSPTRVMIREGKINKISSRTTESSVRYLFLLSDMILLCSLRSSYLAGQKYQLRAKLDIAEMSIYQGDDLEITNTFYIEDSTRRIELFTDREDEKRDWMDAIYKAKVDLMHRKSSLRLSEDFMTDLDLGLKEPKSKIKKELQLKCMLCDITFNRLKLKRRKHSCHACGIVICAKCSGSKLPLQYANGKACRVCDPCKVILQGKEAEKRKSGNDSRLSSPEDPLERVNGVLDVPASEPSVHKGYLNLKLRGKKEWAPRYFCLRSDFVLYSYSKDSDDKALCATPMPGMSVVMAEELSKNESVSLAPTEKERSFRLAHSHGRKCFVFCAPNREDALLWVKKLSLASNAEVTSPIHQMKSPSGDANSN